MKDFKDHTITPDIPTPARLVSDDILIRRARLFEGGSIGALCARTYLDTPLTNFLSPKVDKFYSDYETGFKQRAQGRMLERNNLTFVACEKSNPDVIIGQAQFMRFGDDEGYRTQLARRDTYFLRLLAFLYIYWLKVYAIVYGPDKSADPKALEEFMKYGEAEMVAHWNHRPNRWEARSVVVSEKYQGRGIGKMLMKKVIDMAEEEGVVVGLHASEPGKWLYQSVGFELLAPFIHTLDGDEGGGIMLYTPKRLRN